MWKLSLGEVLGAASEWEGGLGPCVCMACAGSSDHDSLASGYALLTLAERSHQEALEQSAPSAWDISPRHHSFVKIKVKCHLFWEPSFNKMYFPFSGLILVALPVGTILCDSVTALNNFAGVCQRVRFLH